jgi:hypothetical protein
MMCALGGFFFGKFGLGGFAISQYGGLWALVVLLVGFPEEFEGAD